MKSFIKSHKRVRSGATGESLSPDPEPSEQRQSEDSFPPSPTYAPTSPTGKTKKLRGLFQRSRGSSQNLLSHGTVNLSPISPSKTTDSPSIIGTRTHEWGINTQRSSGVKPGRISFDSTLSSKSLDSLADLASSHTHPLKEELLQLPLNTVLEIPDKSSNNSLVEIKNIHRRAQILTPDSLTNAGIEIPITPEKSDLDSFDDDLHMRKDYPEVLDLSNNTEARTPERPRAASPAKSNAGISEQSAQVVDEDEAYESDFSFEENERAGRNASIRYYKTQVEIQPQQYVREPGFYINDLIEDDDFDEDMNYFDEENDFNDDEELFNRKYFSDEEEESIPQKETKQKPFLPPSANETPSEDAPLSSTPLKQQSQQLLTGFKEKPSLQSKRSLKYHQLPTNLEQEYTINNRYSWISDDEDSLKIKPQGVNDSYDSLLDEINGIPEDYDSYDDENSQRQQVKPKSKSLKSRNKSNLAYVDSPLNTKFETSGRTVTLFNHPSRSNSVNSQEVVPEQMRFPYMTPISSFTGPNPVFISEKLVELSPISEGSIDGSP